jgi:hypothetical protein
MTAMARKSAPALFDEQMSQVLGARSNATSDFFVGELLAAERHAS